MLIHHVTTHFHVVKFGECVVETLNLSDPVTIGVSQNTNTVPRRKVPSWHGKCCQSLHADGACGRGCNQNSLIIQVSLSHSFIYK